MAGWSDSAPRRRGRHSCLRPGRQSKKANQTAAARLTGGGHDAFSRYERGEVAPLPAAVNLFRLLDKHPELLKDLV